MERERRELDKKLEKQIARTKRREAKTAKTAELAAKAERRRLEKERKLAEQIRVDEAALLLQQFRCRVVTRHTTGTVWHTTARHIRLKCIFLFWQPT